METNVTLENVKELLQQYSKSVDEKLEAAKAEQSDAANALVTPLQEKQTEIADSLGKIEKAIEDKKSFGLAGYEGDKEIKWSWGRFWRAKVLAHSNHVSERSMFQKHAPHELEVCTAYQETRASQIAESIKSFGLERDFNVDDGSEGGFLVPPQIYQGDIIDVVYAQTPILNMPVLRLDNLRGDLPIPVDEGHLTAYHVGENTKPTKSSSEFGLKWLRPKKLGIFTKVSNRLVAFTNNAIDGIVRNKMGRDGSVELSRGLTNGLGADFEPKGLVRYKANMTAGGAIATNGDRFTIDDMAKLKQALAVVNELRDTNSYGALMRPEAYWGMIRTTVKQYSAQARRNAAPMMPTAMLVDPNAIASTFNAKLGHTTQLSATETQGTSTTSSDVFYGDFSLFAYATFRDPIFKVSDVASDGSTGSAFLDDQIYLVMFMEYDCQLLRPAAFAYVTGAETTEANWSN